MAAELCLDPWPVVEEAVFLKQGNALGKLVPCKVKANAIFCNLVRSFRLA